MANVRGSGAKLKNSRPYTVDGKVYSFTHDRSGKLIGVTSKGSNGKFNVAEDLNQPKFTTDAVNLLFLTAITSPIIREIKSHMERCDVSYASIEQREKFLNNNKKKSLAINRKRKNEKGDEDPIAPKQDATHRTKQN